MINQFNNDKESCRQAAIRQYALTRVRMQVVLGNISDSYVNNLKKSLQTGHISIEDLSRSMTFYRQATHDALKQVAVEREQMKVKEQAQMAAIIEKQNRQMTQGWTQDEIDEEWGAKNFNLEEQEELNRNYTAHPAHPAKKK